MKLVTVAKRRKLDLSGVDLRGAECRSDMRSLLECRLDDGVDLRGARMWHELRWTVESIDHLTKA